MGNGTFDAETLQSRLAQRRMGCRIHFLPVVDSTNRLAFRLAREGAPEGTVVLADCQTRGRGRLQRAWQSPPGINLYASLILRPPFSAAAASWVTLMAGVAVTEALSLFRVEGLTLKWPNDILIHGRKVCGILTEMKTRGNTLEHLVVGIGVNVNITEDQFDPDHCPMATSLREETGRIFSREEVAFVLFCSFEKWYDRLLRQGFVPIRDRWLDWTEMTGRRVRVLFQDEVQEGRVVGIDDEGALLLEGEPGVVRRILAGDASIIKE